MTFGFVLVVEFSKTHNGFPPYFWLLFCNTMHDILQFPCVGFLGRVMNAVEKNGDSVMGRYDIVLGHTINSYQITKFIF